MIYISKDKFSCINFSFDVSGLIESTIQFKDVLKFHSGKIDINLEKDFFKKQISDIDSFKKIFVTIDENHEFPLLDFNSKPPRLLISTERLDYLIFRLEEALDKGCFFPGELLDCDCSEFKTESTIIGYMKK